MKSKLTKITLLLLVLMMVLACVVACGKDKTYKITVMDGETEIATFDVKSGDALSKEDVLAKVQKAGYEFVGLYLDPELTEAFVHEDEILSEITLYAKYTQKTLYIRVKQGTGESEVGRVEVRNGGEYQVPIPSKEGYDFAGYTYLNDEENEVPFPTTGTYNFSTDVRLTAHWTKKQLTVTFKNADETVLATQANVEYGTKATAITLDGYTIDGYYLDKEFTEANKITLSAYEVKDNVSVYVKKTARTYTLSVAGWHEATIQVTYGQTYTLIAPEDTTNAIYQAKIGTDADNEWSAFTGYTYQGAAFAVTGVYTYAENIEVIPVYTENPDYNKATVTFWDTVNNVAFDAVTVNRGATVAAAAFPATAKTAKAGYEFGGWFTNPNYAQESTFTAGVQVNENVRVYAKYTAKSFTITVKDTNENGAILATVPVTYGQAFTLTQPTKFGFVFEKYLLGTETFDLSAHETYTYDEDIVLYATFTTTSGNELFVKNATNGYFKERATTNDPFTYVFLTGRNYNFDGYTLASIENGHAITINGSAFTANSPAEFNLELTSNAGGAVITVPAKVVYNIESFGLGDSYNNMILNAANSDSFQTNITEEEYVMTAGVSDFIPELAITNTNHASITMEQANVEIEMKNATGGAFAGEYTLVGNVLNFDNTGDVFTAEEKITLTFKPKYALGNFSDSLTVAFNTAVNVYTNEELREAYGSDAVGEINVLRNIEAVLDRAEYFENNMYGQTKTMNLKSADGTKDYVLENIDAGNPRNRFGGGVYRRTISNKTTDNVVINGNYFTIDGTKLPYISNDVSNRTEDEPSATAGYMLGNVQIGIFLYRCAQIDGTGDYDDMNGVKYNTGHVSFNNLRIVGNNRTEMADAVVSKSTPGYEYKWDTLMMSTSFNGITVRGGTLSLDNTTISNMNLGMMLHGSVNGVYKPSTADNDSQGVSTKLIMRNSLINKCWSNDLYCFDLCDVTLENSRFSSCAGAAIHFDDRAYADPSDNGDISSTLGRSSLNCKLTMDAYTAQNIINWVTGNEPWFVAYGKSNQAGQIMTQMEGALNNYLHRSIISKDATNANIMNFAILVFPASNNWSHDKEGGPSLEDGSTLLSNALNDYGINLISVDGIEFATYDSGMKIYLPIFATLN